MGDLLTVEQVWELSKLWYRDRLLPEFAGRSTEQANQIFEALGLKPSFWRFDVSS
jgi:ribosomal protein L10